MNKRRLLVIFFTVFVDLVGFGMIIPLNPFLARHFGADPFEVGLLMSIYSLMQFLFSPFWGQLSDRYGRRPIILMSLFGAAAAHTWFAFAGSYWALFLARALAGLFGANISTAMAYIADVTEAKDRSKGMGLIGAAFGLGFMLGPFLGGVFGQIGMRLGENPPLGESFSAIVAAVICFMNGMLALFVLHESLPRLTEGESKTAEVYVQAKKKRLSLISSYLQKPVIGSLLLAYFALTLGMAHMEASLFLYVQDRFQWTLLHASFGFAYIGVIMVFTQGFLIRKFLPKYGERRLLTLGIGLAALGFLGVALSPSIPWLTLAVTLLGLGNGLANPALTGSISLLTSQKEQGAALGVNQSLSALGRIIGPALGGLFYQDIGRVSPFVAASCFTCLGLLLVVRVYRNLPEAARGSGKAHQPDSSASTALATHSEVERIDAFQLTNLIQNRVPFLLCRIYGEGFEQNGKPANHSTANPLLRQAQVFKEPADLLMHLKSKSVSLDHPIVLFCDSGERSLLAAKKIAASGYTNVYVLENGIAGLSH